MTTHTEQRPTIEAARRVLRERFGYDAFRAGQERAVSSVLEGRDTLVVLPTGGGKSLCYQVPALLLPGLTVVVSPLISLMKDQVDTLVRKGVPATFLNSTLNASEIADRMRRVASGEVKLLYVAPERFDNGTAAERLRDVGVSLLAIDEAHCISEWGHDFRPSYLRVAQLRERLGAPPAVALTATATQHVRADIARQLRLTDPETIITGFDRTNLHYHVVPTKGDADKDEALVELLKRHDGVAIVYASTRRNVERVTRTIESHGVSVLAYHAGLDDAHRHEVQEAFMTEKVRAIVATNAFGMGIDKPNVRLVVHHAMPGTLEAYYQEAGRAGRDGKHSDVYLLHAFPDRFTHEFFIKGAYPERTTVERVFDRLFKEADRRTGAVVIDAGQIAGQLPGKVSDREVESAVRLLVQCGAVKSEPDSGTQVFVRLLATPERIRKELDASRAQHLALLRALWRVGGDRFNDGITVDLGAIPTGVAPMQAMSLLDDLQRTQFVEWNRLGGGDRIADMRRPLSAWPLDWAALDRRRKNELSKLDAMQQYAYASGCRRGFVLRYFGDPAAGKDCGGCDNCLGTHSGVKAKRGAGVPKPGEKRRVRGVAARPAVEQGDAESLSPADAALLERLRALRSGIAREEKVPAYVVFADRTLAEMAVRRPRSEFALGEVRGVGPMKIEKYGERFLALLRAADETEAA